MGLPIPQHPRSRRGDAVVALKLDAAPNEEARVRDVMETDVCAVRESDTLAFASQLLSWRGARSLPVVNAEGCVVGMLRDRDLLSHAVEGPAGTRPLADIVPLQAVSITSGAGIGRAAAMLSELEIDALPVVDDGQLVGVVTTSDILAARGRALRKTHVTTTPRASDLMRRRVVVARADEAIGSAIWKLLDAAVRHLPVVDDAFRVVGMLSDRDVRTAVGDPVVSLSAHHEPRYEGTVAGIMTRDPLTVFQHASVTEVAEIFVDERIGAVPVVRDDDTLVGIISYVDVIAHFVGRPR